jgi:hypothetical protein
LQHGPVNDTVSYRTAARTPNLAQVANYAKPGHGARARCALTRDRERRGKVGRESMQGGSHCLNKRKNVITHKPKNQIKFRLHH